MRVFRSKEGRIKSRGVVAALALFVALLAGCGGSDGGTGTGTNFVSEISSGQTQAPQPELSGPAASARADLEGAGYHVTILSKSRLEEHAEGHTLLAESGLSVSGRGVTEATVYFFNSPTEAGQLATVVRGLSHAQSGSIVAFTGTKPPDPAFDELAMRLEG